VIAPLALLIALGGALYAPLWPGADQLGPMLLANLFTQSPLGLLRELMIPNLGDDDAVLWAARIGQGLTVVLVVIAALRARHGHQAMYRALHDATFWMIFVALAWWQPWYVVWLVCLAAIDDRPWAASRCWIASLAGLVALFDRFYLVQHWRTVDMLQHNVDTVLLVFMAPILWACVAPLLYSCRFGQVRQLVFGTSTREVHQSP
jgi:hypothetical protein